LPHCGIEWVFDDLEQSILQGMQARKQLYVNFRAASGMEFCKQWKS